MMLLCVDDLLGFEMKGTSACVQGVYRE